MSKLDQKKLSDLLELITVLAFFFLIFVIYAPVSVWSKEQEFEKQSRFNMNNIYDKWNTFTPSTQIETIMKKHIDDMDTQNSWFSESDSSDDSDSDIE